MKTPKYKLKIDHIDTPSGIHKLERDGFSKGEIHKVMYRETAGLPQRQREDMIRKLYDRKE